MRNRRRIPLTFLIVLVCLAGQKATGQEGPVPLEPLRAKMIRPLAWLRLDLNELRRGGQDELDTLLGQAFVRWTLPLSTSLPVAEGGHPSEVPDLWREALVQQAILMRDRPMMDSTRAMIDRWSMAQRSRSPWPIRVGDPDAALAALASRIRLLMVWEDESRDPNLAEDIRAAAKDGLVLLDHLRQLDLPISWDRGLAFAWILAELYRTTGDGDWAKAIHGWPFLPEDRSPLVDLELFLARSACGMVSDGEAEWNEIRVRLDGDRQPSGAWMPEAEPQAPGPRVPVYRYPDQIRLVEDLMNGVRVTGDPAMAEWAEGLLFNALPAMHHSRRSGVALNQQENNQLTGGVAYSPVSATEAVAAHARLYPIWMESAWFRDSAGLVQYLTVPSEIETRMGDRLVRVACMTEYPGDHQINYQVQVDSAFSFQLKVRKPKWAKALTIDQPYSVSGDFVIIEREWTGMDEINLVFVPGLDLHQTAQGERWFSSGPLILAHPVAGQDSVTRTWTGTDLQELMRVPVSSPEWHVSKNAKPQRMRTSVATDQRYTLTARNPATGETEEILLVPMRLTTLRQVTFPIDP